MVMTLIAFASSVCYVMALTQVPTRLTALERVERQERDPVVDEHSVLVLGLPVGHASG
jgi:hypothetical protein